VGTIWVLLFSGLSGCQEKKGEADVSAPSGPKIFLALKDAGILVFIFYIPEAKGPVVTGF
jgi:hypothetical protein